MKEFNLSATVTISLTTTVEAETLAEAIKIAQDRSIESAEWRSDEQQKEVWVSGEYDGSPENIKEE